jgi:hypothetical protein
VAEKIIAESNQNSKKVAAKRLSNSAAVSKSQQRVLTSEEIGAVAGMVWQALTEANELSLSSLKKSVDAPEALIMAAIGWLAREDKLQFTTSGRSTKISLL